MYLISKTLFILMLASFCGFSQKKTYQTYADCEGTINIFKSHTFDLQFIGNKGKSTRFSEYPALSNITSGNQIWFSFIAPAEGEIELDLVAETVGLSLIVFDASDNDVCAEIAKGNAEIKRLIAAQKSTKIGLSKEVSDSYLYPVSVRERKILHFVLIADDDIRENVKMDFRFISEDPSFFEYETKEFNFKQDDFSPSLIFRVRDKVTGNPLVANLVVKGIKQCEGIYHASDLTFDLTRNGKLDFYCEHEGYFFKDSIGISIAMNQEKVILIELEPVRPGKTVQLEELDFIPGTSQFTDKSIPKLKRLNDFLVLNSMLNIEIQGHVYEPGEGNSLAGQKMSEARAKRVMKYLLDNGISKERITAVGFGNTRPIYPAPKHYQEEQANRRVEILIK